MGPFVLTPTFAQPIFYMLEFLRLLYLMEVICLAIGIGVLLAIWGTFVAIFLSLMDYAKEE